MLKEDLPAPELSSEYDPFTPLPNKGTPKLIKYTLGILILLIRLPFISFILLCLYLYNNFFKALVIFKELKRLITLFVQLILYRLLLLCCGVTSIQTSHKFFSRYANLPKMASGFIVLCNHTHPFDFLYFSYILSPTFVKMFVKVKNSGEKEVLLAPLNFGYILKYFLTKDFPLPVVANEVELAKQTPYRKLNIIKLAEHNFFEKEGPIVIFFEGAVTNGTAVLDMNSLLANDIYEYQKKYFRNTIVATISYDDNAGASVSNPILSCLSLLMNPTNTMNVKFATLAKIPPAKEEMTNSIYEIYENTHMIPRAKLTYEDYQAFLNSYRKGNKKSHKKEPLINLKSKVE